MKKIMLFLLIILCVKAQANDFYYYKNEKVNLKLNTKHLYVLCRMSSEQDLNNQLKAFGVVSNFTHDVYYRRLLSTYRNSKDWLTDGQNYFADLKLNNDNLSQEELQRIVNELKKINGIVHVANCFSYKNDEHFMMTNAIWVQLKGEEDMQLLKEEAGKLNYSILGQNPFMKEWVMLAAQPDATLSTLEASQIMYERKLFVSTEPDMRGVMKTTCVNDTYFVNQWGLNNTGQNSGTVGIDSRVCAAWTHTTGSPAVDIAVIDHGFENNHPDLMNSLENNGYDAELGTTPTGIYGSHGTPCAGIIAASGNNSAGISGVARGSQLMSISEQVTTASAAQAADGFNWARLNGAEIISNSWYVNPPSTMLDISIFMAYTSGRSGLGCVVVFATGNFNGAILYPANLDPNIIAVGAMSPCGQRVSPTSCDGEGWGSNFGAQLDVVAPGVFISATDRQGNNGYNINTSMNQYSNRDYTAWFNGTSSACPHVAGIAALILSINPCLTQAQVQTIIRRTAQKVGGYSYNTNTADGTWNNEMGFGLVNAEAAVIMAKTKYLQNTNQTGTLTLQSPIILAGHHVNSFTPFGNYATMFNANVNILASQYVEFNDGSDIQGVVNTQITSISGCGSW